ncbi:MAG: GntR family transcriptional regulator [Acidimicrobiia bacterium]
MDVPRLLDEAGEVAAIVGIDPADPTPPYEQIRRQVEGMVAAGTLRAGHRLPSVRQLATDLGIAPNTAARAYRELEASGWIHTRGRHGSFVAVPPESKPNPDSLASEAAARFAVSTRQLGITPERAIDLVRQALGTS